MRPFLYNRINRSATIAYHAHQQQPYTGPFRSNNRIPSTDNTSPLLFGVHVHTSTVLIFSSRVRYHKNARSDTPLGIKPPKPKNHSYMKHSSIGTTGKGFHYSMQQKNTPFYKKKSLKVLVPGALEQTGMPSSTSFIATELERVYFQKINTWYCNSFAAQYVPTVLLLFADGIYMLLTVRQRSALLF